MNNLITDKQHETLMKLILTMRDRDGSPSQILKDVWPLCKPYWIKPEDGSAYLDRAMPRKEASKVLDLILSNPDRPATARQRDYLTDLINQNSTSQEAQDALADLADETGQISLLAPAYRVSTWIDVLVSKGGAAPNGRSQGTKKSEADSTVDVGYYGTPSHPLIEVRWNRSQTHKYAMVAVKGPKAIKWVFSKGLIKELIGHPEWKLTDEQGEARLHEIQNQ